MSGSGSIGRQQLLSAMWIEIIALVIAIGLSAWLIYSQPKIASPSYAASPQPYSAGPWYSEVMTPAEVAFYLHISEVEVRQLITSGQLPAAPIGGDFRIAKSAVQDYLRRGTSE
jgi:excisionase family DNA binding protein